MIFDFHPAAETEFFEAISYYEDCEPGLGQDFALEVHAAIGNAVRHPTAWPILGEEVRRCQANRFPYGILYSFDSDRIYVLAVMHLHRHPGCWKNRI